ncbi:MAG TPA: manganese efflux pump MntP family protein [Candidatus Hydrogenedentes bacterium]|nr:manganese efflux pump MntP family protein [Candidatus Hydrogenedentota bacterium]
MNPIEVIVVAIVLSMDAFAAAIATSSVLGKVSGRQLFRLSFHFGLFQAGMPVLGWLAGTTIVHWVERWDHWVAFGLLAFVGCKAIIGAFSREDGAHTTADATRGMTLIILSVATSIDAFAVGLSFAMLDVNIWFPCICIGIITGIITLFGMLMGGRLGERFGRRVEILGGLVLIGIGVKILLQHIIG